MKIQLFLLLTVCSFSMIQPAEAWSFNFANLGEMYSKIIKKIDDKTGFFFLWKAVSKETEKWDCGNVETMITLKAAYQLDKPECAVARNRLGDACKEHDKCYAKREGSADCDEKFCTEVVNICKKGDCGLSSDDFCNAIKKFGPIAYGDDKKPELTEHFRRQDRAPENATTTL